MLCYIPPVSPPARVARAEPYPHRRGAPNPSLPSPPPPLEEVGQSPGRRTAAAEAPFPPAFLWVRRVTRGAGALLPDPSRCRSSTTDLRPPTAPWRRGDGRRRRSGGLRGRSGGAGCSVGVLGHGGVGRRGRRLGRSAAAEHGRWQRRCSVWIPGRRPWRVAAGEARASRGGMAWCSPCPRRICDGDLLWIGSDQRR